MLCVDCGADAHDEKCEECGRPLCKTCAALAIDGPPDFCMACSNEDLKESLEWEKTS